jgi:beta-xylosidase
LPAHFTYWRPPIKESYAVSPEGHPNALRLTPSRLNLTALNGNYAGPTGQTFVSRRQQHTLFTFSVDLDFAPAAENEEAGVTVFLTQNHHLDLGVVMLPAGASTTSFPGIKEPQPLDKSKMVPHFRFRGESYTPVPAPVAMPVPGDWAARTLTLEIKAANTTHYSFSAAPADKPSLMQTLMYVSNQPVSYAFTGTLLGIYCTSNGGSGASPAYFSKWRYLPQGQIRA